MTTAAEFIAGFEGYAGRAYWDVNAFRIGYGSDTEGPDQAHVTEGMETTKARALQNLALRIPQFQTEAVYGKTGMTVGVWDKLTENQRTAITSLVYNYGRLPVIITPSDPEKTATAIRGLQNANGGVNRKRRIAEAAFYLTPDVAIAPQPASPAAVPQAQVVPSAQAPAPVPLPVPAALPPILSTSAARIAAQIDTLTAMRAQRVAELIAADPEIAAYDAGLAVFTKFGSASALPSQSAIPPSNTTAGPAANSVITATPQLQGIQAMFGTSWITSLFGTGSIASAAVTVAYDIFVTKQAPDPASLSLIVSSVMSGIGLIMAKDANVTGGTVPATIEATARASSPPITK